MIPPTLWRDERGSGFGSALLLVAVVSLVVLTAVLFFGTPGLSSEQAEKPEPTIGFNYSQDMSAGDELRIRHVDGARINPEQLAVTISGARCTGSGDPNGRYSAAEDFGLTESNWLAPGMALVIDADTPVVLCENGGLDLQDGSVELVWQSPEEEFELIRRWTA